MTPVIYDAIVIGSGISGGWAAKELCEKGLKTLLIERGRKVEHIKDYPTATKNPWELPHRGEITEAFRKKNPLITRSAGFGEDNAHFFIEDAIQPYVQEKPFDWIRGYQLGGKSIIWGRATQRWSDYEFTGPQRFGYGFDWPIRYKDVDDWYSHVEEFIGICGNADGIASMPDGKFMKPFDLNCVEQHLKEVILKEYGPISCSCKVGPSHRTKTHTPRTGKGTMPGKKSLYAGMPVRRLFQLSFIHHSLGAENRKPYHRYGCSGSFSDL